MYNIPLLTEVRDVIRDNPSRHNQRHYIGSTIDMEFNLQDARQFAHEPLPDEPMDELKPVCMTTACVAGWMIILGSDTKTVVHLINTYNGLSTTEIIEYDESEITECLSYGSLEHRAIELSGLPTDVTSILFYEDRTRDEVLDILDYLIEHPDEDVTITLPAVESMVNDYDEDEEHW
jgi:hypothetical protein